MEVWLKLLMFSKLLLIEDKDMILRYISSNILQMVLGLKILLLVFGLKICQ